MADIQALARRIKGSYRTLRIKSKPTYTLGLLSLTEPISENYQLVFWYPKTLSYDTAKWLAKEMANDLKTRLPDK